MSRIFLACTPRTGNVWFRKMLAGVMGGKDFAAHFPAGILWDELEAPCIVAMHWHRTPELAKLLAEKGFETLIIVRNPLDILISILHFSQHEPATAQWLMGEGGDESPLKGADPTSPAFLNYALSPRASLLLRVSAEWQSSARAMVRYEELVADPEGTLDLTVRSLNREPASNSSEVVREHTLSQMRFLSKHHFWRGEPGLWRRLIPPDYRQAIYERYADLFDAWGFDPPDPFALSREQARENWQALGATSK